MHYNAGNQLIATADGEIETAYSYDKRGNLVEVRQNDQLVNQYYFGELNRLEKAFNYQTNRGAIYQYNGLGNGIGIIEGTAIEPLIAVTHLDQLNLNLIKEIDDVLDLTKQYHNLLQRSEGLETKNFTWDSNILSMIGDNSIHQYLQDDMGSPVRVNERNGNHEEAYAYDEFGIDLLNNQGQLQPFGYTGYQMDAITGAYYAQARKELVRQRARQNLNCQ